MTTVNRKELVKALDMVKGARPKRAFLPILENVLLESGESVLWLSATDLESHVRTSINAASGGSWSLCVPPDTLKNAVRSAVGDTVGLEVEGTKLKVRTGSGSLVLQGTDSKDWPVTKQPEGGVCFTATGLATMLKRTSHAMQEDDNRPVLHGTSVMLKPHNNMEVATADGFRLAVMQGGCSYDGGELKVIVPFKTVLLSQKVLTDDAVEVALDTKSERVSFSQGRLTLICKLVQGTFPGYTRLIPECPPHRCTVDVKELLQAVNGAKDIAKGSSGIVRFLALTDKGELQVYAKNSDDNEFEARIPCEGDVKVALNWKYITDALKVLEADRMTIETTNPSSPVKIVEGEYTEVIMPMFVEWGD